MRLAGLPLFLAIAVHGAGQGSGDLQSELTAGIERQNKGASKEARLLLEPLIPKLRSARDRAGAAKALDALTKADFSLGDYAAGIEHARAALAEYTELRDSPGIAGAWISIGRANAYLGAYPEAAAAYSRALEFNRAAGNQPGEIVVLNNIANVYYEQGRYQEAWRTYQDSLARLSQTKDQPWNPRLRQVANVNLAILYQRLGRYPQALDLYRSLRNEAVLPPAEEQAQMLANEGTLYRRLGDPQKALDTYRTAQALFARQRHPYGEVGVLRNIGIVLALDLGRLPEALAAFGEAKRLARQSVGAQLAPTLVYLAEALRRSGRTEDAQQEFRAALEEAEHTGSQEYAWQAAFGLGRLAEQAGNAAKALDFYFDAIRRFERVRSRIDLITLKHDFLADKRQVYDATIALLLKSANPDLDVLLRLMENSRSRIYQDAQKAVNGGLDAIRRKLDPATVLLEYWYGSDGSGAVISLSRNAAGLARIRAVDTAPLARALREGRPDWRELSAQAGKALLSVPALQAPGVRSVMIVPDGPLSLIPFEALAADDGKLLIERAAVFYAPSAGVVLRPGWGKRTGWSAPWQPSVLAFGDPQVDAGGDVLAGQYPRLPKAVEEVRYVAAVMPGKPAVFLGKDAGRVEFETAATRGFPILHLSTHANADYQDPERSRILFAGAGGTADYLFLREIYSRDFRSFDLVVLSACETAAGKLIPGEGIEGFGKAFITAGAASAVTALWRVDDAATGQFMKQFYYRLSRGDSRAEALRAAKLEFLGSRTALAAPQYWSAFVLSGDGAAPVPFVLRWWQVLVLPALLAFAILWRIRARSSH